MKTVFKQTADLFRAAPIGIYPEFVSIAGPRAGVVLSVLFAWSSNEPEAWIRKTLDEICETTFMAPKDAKYAVTRLKTLGLIKVSGETGMRIDFDVLAEVVGALT